VAAAARAVAGKDGAGGLPVGAGEWGGGAARLGREACGFAPGCRAELVARRGGEGVEHSCGVHGERHTVSVAAGPIIRGRFHHPPAPGDTPLPQLHANIGHAALRRPFRVRDLAHRLCSRLLIIRDCLTRGAGHGIRALSSKVLDRNRGCGTGSRAGVRGGESAPIGWKRDSRPYWTVEIVGRQNKVEAGYPLEP
jgi:hypothetical protein